jgi:hypothetical protein
LDGADELERFEDSLALLPSWLTLPLRINSVRVIVTATVQYWYYAQIDHLGRTGKTRVEQSVWQATKQVMGQQKAWLKARRALTKP